MAEITTEMVEFSANGSTAPGYLAQPHSAQSDGDQPVPGVVVIQEWWGLNDHIKQVAERCAEAGFVALAPDLYRGEIATEPDDARKLVMALEFPRAVADIQGAVDYLRALGRVEPKQIGVVGFCMGGVLTGLTAVQGRDIGAAVGFYGVRALSDEDAEKISAPLLAIYGEADSGYPLEMVRENERKLQAAGKTAEVVVYPGAPHAFFNDTRPSFRPEAAEDAWARTLAWFRAHLR
ncbi:MAG: dienelactone hydrolase family protein [Chloroflexi bacterium]|nr:dienelactone hydrolase family protein [Chloroflexota bacterium]